MTLQMATKTDVCWSGRSDIHERRVPETPDGPTITSGGNPPAFSLTSDGKLTAKNADISGSVNANAGTLNNVTINEELYD